LLNSLNIHELKNDLFLNKKKRLYESWAMSVTPKLRVGALQILLGYQLGHKRTPPSHSNALPLKFSSVQEVLLQKKVRKKLTSRHI